jgi:hypothetical protein
MASASDVRMRILAEDKTGAAFRSANKNLDRMNQLAGKAKAGMLLLTAAIGAVGAAAKKFAAAADEIAKFSKRTGISTDSLQELGFVATQSGVDIQAFNKAIVNMVKNFSDAAEGTGEAYDEIKKLGIQLTDAEGRMRPAEDLLNDLADAMGTVTNDTEKLAIATKIFGGRGSVMVQMLENGSSEMQKLREEARRLGIVLDSETLVNAEKVTDEFDRMSRIIDTNLTKSLVNLAPYLNNLTENMANATAAMAGFLNRFEDPANIQSMAAIRVEIDRLVKKREELRASMKGMTDEDVLGVKEAEVARVNDRIAQLQEQVKKLMMVQAEAQGKSGAKAKPKTPTPELGFFDNFTVGIEKGFEKYRLEIKDTAKFMQDATVRAFQGMEDALVTFVQTGKLNFRDLANSIVADLIRIQVREMMTKSFSFLAGDLFGNLFGSSSTTGASASVTAGTPFATRASGGPVGAGRSYLVGESGPELLTMGSSSGYVTPSAASAGGPITINYNIQSWDSRDTMDAIQKSAPQIVGIVQNAFNKRGRRGPMG